MAEEHKNATADAAGSAAQAQAHATASQTSAQPTPLVYGVINETTETESRVALTPDIVTRLSKAGIACQIESGAGVRAQFTDDDYRASGAQVVDRATVLTTSAVIATIGRLSSSELAQMPSGTTVIGMLQSFTDSQYVEQLKQHGIVALAMERLPRQISAAQSMDAMTSQNSVMGYQAVLVAASRYGALLPMMTTAAGTVRPATVLILGAGIAGLQAIGTAKRLGAKVTAYDVRPAAREEVKSLGAQFLELDVDLSSGQGEGGYARALTDEERAAQQAAVDAQAAKFDIVITTAQVPGRKPPVLLTQAGVEAMKRGSVIVDCAASELGGNVEGSTLGERVTDGGVTIIGAPYLTSQVATTASQLFARNLADVCIHVVRDGKVTLDPDDAIDAALAVSGL